MVYLTNTIQDRRRLPDDIDRTLTGVLTKTITQKAPASRVSTFERTIPMRDMFPINDFNLISFLSLPDRSFNLKGQFESVCKDMQNTWYTKIYNKFLDKRFYNKTGQLCVCCGKFSPKTEYCKNCEKRDFYKEFHEKIEKENYKEAMHYYLERIDYYL